MYVPKIYTERLIDDIIDSLAISSTLNKFEFVLFDWVWVSFFA